ncbi:MAG: hypothetical protein AAF587_34450 [Bacteroidota bacterium]
MSQEYQQVLKMAMALTPEERAELLKQLIDQRSKDKFNALSKSEQELYLKRTKILDELTQEAQELGFYD